MPLLSKTDFILGQDCLAKLFLKRNGFPSNKSEDLYLQSLAKMGHLVGKIAQIQFGPGQISEMARDPQDAVESTRDWLSQNVEGTLFEATFSADGCYARVDVLVKNGDSIQLIEVKSAGINEDQKQNRRRFSRDFDSKLNDLTFQYLVALSQYPEYSFTPHLALMDKGVQNNITSLFKRFSVLNQPNVGNYQGFNVLYTGNEEALAELQLLHVEPCIDMVNARIDSVDKDRQAFVQAYQDLNNFENFKSPLGSHCAGCEFRTTPIVGSGFHHCWGERAMQTPHILSVAKDAHFSKLVTECIHQGGSTIQDIPLESMYNNKGIERVNGRPIYQRNQEHEVILPELFHEISNLNYPLFFVDFETIRSAIPFHSGQYPYDIELFQWSVHKLSEPSGNLEHFEYLNEVYQNPNDTFISTLREVIGDEGTVLTWSSYENTQIKNYLENLQADRDDVDHDLANWLLSILKDRDGGRRQVDMHDDWIRPYYYHQLMGGRTSIKVVLPAILSENQPSKNIALLSELGLYSVNEEGQPLDPYKLLDGISDGTKAMQAYEQLITHEAINAHHEELIKQGLLAYCRLDTLSMVLIYNYLISKAS